MSDDHKPRRQRMAPPPAGDEKAPAPPAPACPGRTFTVTFEGGRKATLNLAGLPRGTLADQTAGLVWDEVQRRAPKGSRGIVEHPQNALRLFCAWLEVADERGRIQTFSDIVDGDVDGFEDHLRAKFADSTYGDAMMRAFLALLRDAANARLTGRAIAPRLARANAQAPRKAGTQREPFPMMVMANLRKAAEAGVRQVLKRRCAGERRLRHAAEVVAAFPEPPGGAAAASKLTAAAARFTQRAAAEGPPEDLSKRARDLFAVENGISIAGILGDLHAASVDAVAFAILIAADAGIPIESVRDLKAGCLRNERRGHATLHFVKRRAGGDGLETIDVATTKRMSAGWLIKLFLAISKRTRRHASPQVAEWLFIGYAQRRILRLEWAEAQVGAFLRLHRPLGEDGKPMGSAQLSRIRKNAKQSDYRSKGGDLKRFANDHSRQVAATHYARIAANTEIHENAITLGLRAALDASSRTRAGTDAVATTTTAAATPDEGEDVAVARCSGFERSPYSAPGRPCSAPLLGCLDCPNAVVSEVNLGPLLQLLHDLVQKRQEMDLGSWVATCGTSYARILTILDLFPKAAIARAAEEAASACGRSWPVAQLAYKV